MLRAYNSEADRLVATMRPYKLDAAIDRLEKARDTISRLGRTMSIAVSPGFHQLRLDELKLTADYLARVEEEREAEREEKQRLREEAAARREYDAEKQRLRKEQLHYQNALARLRENGDATEAAKAEAMLAEIGAAIEGVEAREANHRAGYVYVISNVGSFGDSVVKIGMTRRLEPLDRVRELGDASVPFRFDVHAMVFSDDAVTLESQLHAALADRRVNLVNQRREFFYATPVQVQQLLQQFEGSLLEFTETADAEEWHQSENSRPTAIRA
jgi:F0F1-type ATP synthase epsilon subunit